MIPGSITLEESPLGRSVRAEELWRESAADLRYRQQTFGPQAHVAEAGNRIFVTMVTVGGRATRDNGT